MPATTIGMLATMYMVGVGIGAFAFSWMPDYFGRRATLIYCGLVTVPAQLVMCYWPNYYAKMVSFILIAVFFINKTVCFNFMFELTDEKHLPACLAIITCWDTISLAIISLVYLFYKEW